MGPELSSDAQLIAPHQATAGVQQRQFAAAIGAGEGPLDLEGGRGTALVLGAAISRSMEAQVGLGAPGLRGSAQHGQLRS